MNYSLLVILAALALFLSSVDTKKLKAKVDKLDSHGKPNPKVKKMVDSMRQNGQAESQSDEHGNSLKLVRKGKGKEMVVEQLFQGIKVFGARILDEDIEGGAIEVKDGKGSDSNYVTIDVPPQTLQTGDFIEGLDMDFPDLNKGQLQKLTVEMEKKLRKEYKNLGFKVSDVEAEPVVWIDREQNDGILAIYVTLYAYKEDEQTKPTVIYNEDGEEVARWDDYQKGYVKIGTGPGGNPNTGKYEYGGDTKATFTVKQEGSDCYLETEQFRTYHWITAATNNDFSAHKFPCPKQTGDEKNEGYGPMADAHANAEITIKMLKSWYKVVPFMYLPLQLRVHYGSSFYAGYNTKTGQLNFADGPATVAYPLVTLDIVAHEMGHAITEYGSATVYTGQSGGLNEAFSDMTAMAALHYNNESVSWKVMDKIFKPAYKLKFIRCMDSPTCDSDFGGKSIDHISKYVDPMDTHHSSGLFNKVFYLIAKEYNVWDAYDIMFAANTKIWTSTTGFLDGASGVLTALEKMKTCVINFGYNYSWISDSSIVDIFSQVGIACSKDASGWKCVKA